MQRKPPTKKKSESRSSAAQPQPNGNATLRTALYRVHPGDDLRSIAVQFYGRRDFWVFIFIANPGEIHGLQDLRPGKVLRIPALFDDGDRAPDGAEGAEGPLLDGLA